VDGVKDLLIWANSRILELVLDGAEPVVSIKRLSGLGKGWRVGVLKVPEYGAGLITSIATIVVVVGGHLGEVLKCGEVGLALGTRYLTVLHHNAQ
jgi:hypothetical protein